MEIEEYYAIKEASRRRIQETALDTRRYLMDRIEWRDRLIAVIGSRGTGKTTMLLQHIKERWEESLDEVLYISLDHLWFETHSLIELIDLHYKNGGTHIFIDEVHYQKDWQRIIKNIYDDYPRLHIVYTGSSLLRIDAKSGDLSRRQITYRLPGLSFREYLRFEGVEVPEALTLPQLLEEHIRIAEEITGRVKILREFQQYLVGGYFPFYKEVYYGYDTRMTQIINQVLESDYPTIEAINYSTIQKIKKMLYILAQSCPQTPNMSALYQQLDTDRNLGLKMLYILDKANLLNLLSSEKATLKRMAKPDRIYCDNTNIMYALTERIDTGTKRETYFLNQLRSAGYDVTYPEKGDFLVNGRYLFEVGGRNKKFDQIKDIADSYLAVDDEEVGWGNRIPLWLYGFLY